MKKKLITFLGTTDYQPTVYYFNNKPAAEKYGELKQRFVQIPICGQLDENTEVIVFLTQKAKENNWLSINGLKDEFDKRKVKYKPVDIKTGENESELWDNFNIIYDQFERDDEIYVDVTHSFRSIPIIFMSLINYASVTKNIRVKNIYYGAYESRDTVDYLGTKIKIVPVFELSFFNVIQKWGTGAVQFLKTGSYKELSDIITETRLNIDKSTLDFDKKNLYRLMDDINNQLKKYSKDLWACRGKNISKDAIRLKNSLNKLGNITIKEFSPISNVAFQIAESLEGYNGDVINDSIHAVEECQSFGLIQQSYTLLREILISYVAIKAGLDYRDFNQRKQAKDIIGYYMDINNISKRYSGKYDSALVQSYLYKFINIDMKEIADIYDELSKFRNDINHAGFKLISKSYSEFTTNINKYVGIFKEKLLNGQCDAVEESQKSVIVILSHELLKEQINELEEKFRVNTIVKLPDIIQQELENIDPTENEDNAEQLKYKIEEFIVNNSKEEDYVIVQGEWGMTFSIVNFCLENNRIPIYASTKRYVKEIKEGGSVRVERVFVHAGFKRYKY